jgi:tetratricopeptide (TPR) repeat protein
LLEQKDGKLDKARELFQKGSEADPSHAPTWQAWALLEQKDGKLDKARELFQKGSEADPSDAPIWQAWALLEQKDGKLDKARGYFQKAVKFERKRNNQAKTLYSWAALEQSAGQYAEAIRLLRDALERDPESAQTAFAEFQAARDQGNFHNVRRWAQRASVAGTLDKAPLTGKDLKKLIADWRDLEETRGGLKGQDIFYAWMTALEPEDFRYWRYWGTLARKNHDREMAESRLNRALELTTQLNRQNTNPEYSSVLQELAILADDWGETNNARLMLDEAIQANPDNIDALNVRARLEYFDGHSELAHQFFESTQTRSNKQRRSLSLQMQAAIFRDENKLKEAKSLLNRALHLNPDNVSALQLRAVIYAEQRDFAHAFEDLKIAASISGDSLYYWKARGEVLQKQGKNQLAWQSFSKAYELIKQDLYACPNNSRLLNLRAQLLIWMRNFQLAQDILRTSESYAPPGHLHYVYEIWGQLHLAQGDPQKAKESWERARELSPHWPIPHRRLQELEGISSDSHDSASSLDSGLNELQGGASSQEVQLSEQAPEKSLWAALIAFLRRIKRFVTRLFD